MRRSLAGVLLLAACGGASQSSAPAGRLHYILTAQQFGPVSFRDPLGVMSPDGHWLAWSVQEHLYVQRLTGGAVFEFPRHEGLITHLAWLPDSRGIAAMHRFSQPAWWLYDLDGGTVAALWPAGLRVTAGSQSVAADSLRQLAYSRDGGHIVGIIDREKATELWTFPPSGDNATVLSDSARVSFPVFAPDGRVVCLKGERLAQVVSDPCGKAGTVTAFGPLAFSSRGDTMYYAAPDAGAGTLDVWKRAVSGGTPVRLTGFGRDTYAPTVAPDGTVLVKLQMYRTVVGIVDANGGPVRAIAGFRSETPSWDPTGKYIGITYGTWRRVTDDIQYPDIAQDIGIIRADPDSLPSKVERAVDASVSEDQSMAWSPNGKWIVYHSHKDLGDDVWIVPADGSAKERRLTHFGRGFETGWPRWSPDGKQIAFDSDSKGPSHLSVIYVMGLDQDTGEMTSPEREIPLPGFPGEAVHVEWLPGNRLAILGDVKPGVANIMLTSATGDGKVQTIHTWNTEHKFSGLASSPDGKNLVFTGPTPEGHFQLFRIPVTGGTPVQLTFDPTNKTQPSYSPDGKRIALTVWEYSVQFWEIR